MAREIIERRQPTKAEILEILAKQGVAIDQLKRFSGSTPKAVIAAVVAQFGGIPCGKWQKGCPTIILSSADCVRDHKISLRRVPAHLRAEYDRPWNQEFLCHICNDKKTHKGTLSDAASHAKLRRQDKRYGGELPRRCPKIPARPIRSKGWPETSRPLKGAGRKIPSRPFAGKRPAPRGEAAPG